MNKSLAWVFIGLMLTACGPSKKDSQYSVLMGYGKAIRWGEISMAAAYLAPEYLEKNPIHPLEMSRWQQVKVTHYSESQAILENEDTLRQTVSFSVVNRHTGVERQLVDHQLWKYNHENKRWWLWSGLPKLTTPRR